MTRRRAVSVILSGRVQGVGFRAWTAAEADRRGLDGWVRNRSDGTVETLFAGPADAVHDMLSACRSGPPAARVTDLRTAPADDPGHTGFEQRPTV